MVCIDNSDYTRNGDYAPTRFDSQTDAVNLVCGAKTQQNPENSVGILATAGDRIEVMITPTTDLGKMISELPKIQVGGTSDLLRGIKTAQLALKHRQNKNQKQRIIAFVGSPIAATEKELETLGKDLKKNNVSLDLVSFGEVEENTGKLDKLLSAVNSNDTSHMVEVPVGPKLLSDVLLSSVIINADGEGGMGGGGGGDGFEFGINPNDDPELALALRISMEEERARQQATAPASTDAAAAAGAGAAAAGEGPPAAAVAAATTPAPPAPLPMATDAAVMEAMGMEDMDEELRQALLLSLQDSDPMQTDSASPEEKAVESSTATAPVPSSAPSAQAAEAPKSSEAPAAAAAGAPAAGGGDDAAMDSKWFQDPSFVQELLGSLPGVDINDPRIQSALKEVQGGDKDKDKDKEGSGGAGGSGDGGDAPK